MIRYAAPAASHPEPIKVREVSAAKPAIEIPPPKPVIEVAAAAPAAGLLLPSSEADEFGLRHSAENHQASTPCGNKAQVQGRQGRRRSTPA
ncbi:hypothetical protein ACVIEM_005075 [Rhizobium leguminosarum]